MDSYSYSADVGWTDEQWTRVKKTITEEALKTRVGATFLPISAPSIRPSKRLRR